MSIFSHPRGAGRFSDAVSTHAQSWGSGRTSARDARNIDPSLFLPPIFTPLCWPAAPIVLGALGGYFWLSPTVSKNNRTLGYGTLFKLKAIIKQRKLNTVQDTVPANHGSQLDRTGFRGSWGDIRDRNGVLLFQLDTALITLILGDKPL